jgi:glycosyltransferase involved in cell wall biosynthesis
VAASAVPATLAALDALALPSLTRPNWMEQFGRVLIEAMACGVPVVGSDSGEIPRVIGAAGLIVPDRDEGALRESLWRLAEHPELCQRLAEAGRARVLAEFTQEQVARQLADVYAAVLRRGAARPSMREEEPGAHETLTGERSD